MSTIKVDTIATRTGSGNITLSNNVASLTSAGAISGTNLTASGTLTVTGDLTVDTNTLIVDASENTVNINNNVQTMNGFADDLVIGDGSNPNGITIYTGTGNAGSLNFADGTSGSSSYQGYLQYNHSSNQFAFYTDYATNGSTPRIVFPSSGGIAFNGDSAAANALDDYEEGQWTPDVRNNTSTSNWSTKKGDYVKIGRVVYCWFVVDHGNSNSGSGTAQLELTGLPFAVQLEANSGSTFAHNSTQSFGMWSSNPSNQVGNLMTAGSNTTNLYKGGGGTASQMTFVSGSFCYIATT